MASNYIISSGTGRISLGDITGTFIAIQVVADAALNADITVKLQHTEDDTNFLDIDNTSETLLSGGGSVRLQTADFTLLNAYLFIDVGSATLGELSLLTSLKKKEDSGSVEISGAIDANITNSELDVNVTNDLLSTSDASVKEILLEIASSQRELIIELKINNKILMECFEIEIEPIDVDN